MRVEVDFNGETVFITDSKIERRLASRYGSVVTEIVSLEKNMAQALSREVGLVREGATSADGQSVARYATDLSVALSRRNVLIQSMNDMDIDHKMIVAITDAALSDSFGFVYVISEQVWAEHASHAPAPVERERPLDALAKHWAADAEPVVIAGYNDDGGVAS